MRRHIWIPGSLLVAVLWIGSPWPGGSGPSGVPSANAQLSQGSERRALPPWSLAWFRKKIWGKAFQHAGGKRNSANRICLITPWPAEATGTAPVMVYLPKPVIATDKTLSRLQIVSADASARILYEQRATSRDPLRGPFEWPAVLQPLQPGETVILKLQPTGAGEHAYVILTLQAVTGERQQRAQQLLASGSDRLALVEEQARSGQLALAVELLFAPMVRPSRSVEELRAALLGRDCSRGSSA